MNKKLTLISLCSLPMCVCVCEYMYACMCVCICVWVYMCVCVVPRAVFIISVLLGTRLRNYYSSLTWIHFLCKCTWLTYPMLMRLMSRLKKICCEWAFFSICVSISFLECYPYLVWNWIFMVYFLCQRSKHSRERADLWIVDVANPESSPDHV